MRTTIRIEDELLARAKALAAQNRTSLNCVVEEALRERLNRPQLRSRPDQPLPTVTGRGPRPGINLNSNADLLDHMEGE